MKWKKTSFAQKYKSSHPIFLIPSEGVLSYKYHHGKQINRNNYIFSRQFLKIVEPKK